MARQRINPKAPLTNAEKQRRYREKRKEEMYTLKAYKKVRENEPSAHVLAAKLAAETAQDMAAISEHGRIIGICEAAYFFIEKNKNDIAQHLLSHFMIDRDKAAAALEADKRTSSISLKRMDKARAWSKPAGILK